MGLVQENQQLRTLLKQYLDGISVNDEIISQVNPLFIVNNKTNIKYVFDKMRTGCVSGPFLTFFQEHTTDIGWAPIDYIRPGVSLVILLNLL